MYICKFLNSKLLLMCILYLLLCCSVNKSFANDITVNLPLQSYFQYQDLQEKPDDIDMVCLFDSQNKKIEMMKKFCNFDDEQKNTTKILDKVCIFKDNQTKASILKNHCSFRSPRSVATIIGDFCQMKTQSKKLDYIAYLQNIAKVGERFQRTVNYSIDAERLTKRQDAINPIIYHVNLEPHTEAAYQLGIIYGFSSCGMRSVKKSISFLQKAHDKPETFFMTAELYRSLHQKKLQRRIYTLYNDAINVGIDTAHYNLALYIYEALQEKNTDALLAQDFTYKNMLIYLKQAAEKNDFIAQNDLAVLMNTFNSKQKNQKKFHNMIDTYILESAEQGFIPAIYNQTIRTLSKPCTHDTKKIVKKNMTYLRQEKYEFAIDLFAFIKNNNDVCYQSLLQENESDNNNKGNHSDVDKKKTDMMTLLETNAFNEFYDNIYFHNPVRSGV